MKEISDELYNKLRYLGIIDESGVRGRNFGAADYNEDHICTPWAIFLDHPDLNFWEQDIIKRILRRKDTDPRRLELQKMIHDCEEMLRQIDVTEEEENVFEGLFCPTDPLDKEILPFCKKISEALPEGTQVFVTKDGFSSFNPVMEKEEDLNFE